MRLQPNYRLLALAAVAAAALAPYAADSGTCSNPAAMDLLAASYADSQLNSPKGEDTNFFIKAGGVPNIMVLLDTTGSMNRLPPDGPNNFGSALPPGYYIGTNVTDATTQTNAFNANDTTPAAAPKYTASTAWTSPAVNRRIVGCGIDPVSAGNADFTGSAMYQILESRRFSPPCGQAVDSALVGARYNGAADYGANMTVCPYFTSSNNQAVGAPGFDPDYYDAADPMATSSGSKKIFFGRSLIFHDNPDMNAGYARNTGLAFGHNFGDGFYYDGLSPALVKSSGAKATIATFCNDQGTAAPRMQGGLSHASICSTCLTTKGWYYDGVIYEAGENNAPTPSIWYTGNYLTHYPPKFLIARKVMKDIIAVQSRIRMALVTFSGNVGAAPVANFIQPFNPTCGMPDSSNFDSNRASYVSGVDGITFGGGTPLATALFDAGRYYHSPDLPWFGNAWESNTKESSANANQAAVCYSCQTSSVILITDGQPSGNDGDALPGPAGLASTDLTSNKKAGDASTGIRGIGGAVCPECDEFKNNGIAGDDYKDHLTEVAFYLQNMDLRRDAETTLDCKGNQGKQVIDTYTIGFATKGIPSVNTILSNAAKVGGGMFVPAENTSALKEGFNAIIEEINGRSTSFSVATVSTLQTMSGGAAHVPRFSPGKTAHWPGRLFRYELYSEFVNMECKPFGAGDYNCDGRCDGVYLQDADGDFISEDPNGAFVKNDPPDRPVCAQAPKCGTNCAVSGSAPAKPFWDGADAWGPGSDTTKKQWKERNVWTAVDTDLDGDIDQDDGMIDLKGANDAAAKAIIPYLALGGGGVCNLVGAKLSTAGDLASAALVSADQLQCAKAILRFVLGADLFNERGLDATLYPPTSMDEAVDRSFILGDIFHSSPARVVAPHPTESKPCRMGLVNQCLMALWETDTKNGVEGYTEYQKSGRYRDRRRIVLVGGNDGMLHAFNDGIFVADGEGGGDWESGKLDGAMELWGFIPPDLLAKLPLLLATDHHLFVDGTAMVRDVWVDGSANGLGKGTYNDIKEGTEFHTVAVVGERRGGTRFFALDVTDATEKESVPKFLWIYPQPNSKEAVTFGETYTDFLPMPPPIGPVRVATGSVYPTTADSPAYNFDGSKTPFHETWVAFLNGGYDPQYVRGRGVHMVDVWTGKELWDFSYPENPATGAADDPRLNLRFPIPAVVGMVRWGLDQAYPNETKPMPERNYFDTATFGDAGGQLWTLRFHVPAKLDANGLATNWYGGRSLQIGGKTGCKLCGGQPFFQMTANTPLPSTRFMRTFAGTGDRFNLTDKYGGTCSPNNLRACVMRGCTVTVTQTNNVLSAPGPGFSQRGMTEVACNALTSSQLAGPTVACQVDATAKVVISACPSPDPNSSPVTTTKEMVMQCTELADGYQCKRSLAVAGSTLSLSTTVNAPTIGNWFFSLRMFRDGSSADPFSLPVFNTAAEAKSYDAHRHWVTQVNGVVNSAPYPDGPRLISSTSAGGDASEDSAGWAIYYYQPGTVTIDGTSVNVDWRDERTASGTALTGGLVSWNTVIPPISAVTAASTGSCRVSRCTQEDRRVNFTYGANPVTGAASDLFLDASGNKVRSIGSYRLVPAQAMQATYFVNAKGQVQTALTSVSPEGGASNLGSSAAEDAMSDADFLVIDKELYECRHASSPVCK
jgi:type IV pilus assembly protein PilY1